MFTDLKIQTIYVYVFISTFFILREANMFCTCASCLNTFWNLVHVNVRTRLSLSLVKLHWIKVLWLITSSLIKRYLCCFLIFLGWTMMQGIALYYIILCIYRKEILGTELLPPRVNVPVIVPDSVKLPFKITAPSSVNSQQPFFFFFCICENNRRKSYLSFRFNLSFLLF